MKIVFLSRFYAVYHHAGGGTMVALVVVVVCSNVAEIPRQPPVVEKGELEGRDIYIRRKSRGQESETRYRFISPQPVTGNGLL